SGAARRLKWFMLIALLVASATPGHAADDIYLPGGAGPAPPGFGIRPLAEEPTVRPHWCNDTPRLVENIAQLGGESVMRRQLPDGRRLEHYWNATEEVVIEHGLDGTSCLVEMRVRIAR
ncbi:MAG: hypothetical protein AB7E80_13340, partial [Hyphomicrobiaceae bacterium]